MWGAVEAVVHAGFELEFIEPYRSAQVGEGQGADVHVQRAGHALVEVVRWLGCWRRFIRMAIGGRAERQCTC